jgi:hypothetical protein
MHRLFSPYAMQPSNPVDDMRPINHDMHIIANRTMQILTNRVIQILGRTLNHAM